MVRTLEERRRFLAAGLERLIHEEEGKDYYAPHQMKALRKTLAYFGNGESKKTSGLIKHPTASGKTRLMIATLKALYGGREESSGQREEQPPRVLWVTPTQPLLLEGEKRLRREFPELPFGVYYADRKDYDEQRQDLTYPVTLITYDSFYALVSQGIIKPQDIDMLLLDETHRGLSEDRKSAIDLFRETSLMEGFSASPDFDQVKGAYRILGEAIDDLSDTELIEQGWLPPRANIIAEVALPGDITPDRQMRKKAYTDAALSLIKSYQDNMAGNEPILGQQGLIYAFDIQHAEDTANKLNADTEFRAALIATTGNPAIIPAAAVHSGMNTIEAERIFNAYEQGKISVLVGDQMFIEGVDMPRASWEMTRPGTSKVETIQKGGRIGRRDEKNLAKIGRVFNIVVSKVEKDHVFYHDVLGERGEYGEPVGAARVGKIAREDIARRYHLQGGAKTTAPASDITLYNSPGEVEDFLHRVRPRPRKGATILYLPKRMEKAVSALPGELDQLYAALREKYTEGSEEKPVPQYLEIAGYSIRRDMLRMESSTKPYITEPYISIQDIAVPIVRDIITLPPTDDNFMTEEQVQEAIQGSRYSSGTMHGYFEELREKYLQSYLASKYPLKGDPPLPEHIIIEGFNVPIPLDMVRFKPTDDGPVICLHEDIMRQYFHRDLRNKPAHTVSRSAYERWYGTARNLTFQRIWQEIRRKYDRHPFPIVEIDGERIECGYFWAPSHKTHFYIHSKHTPWLEKEIGRISGNTEGRYLSHWPFFKRLQVSWNHPEGNALWNDIKLKFDRTSPKGPVTIDGHDFKCGYVEDSRGFHFFSLAEEELYWFSKQAGIPLRAQPGWKSASMLSEEYVGGVYGITKKLEKLQQDLLLEEKIPEAAVHKEWVGLYRHPENAADGKKSKGGRATLYASPAAVRRLEQLENEWRLVPNSERIPAPPGWLTAKMLQKTYGHNDDTINRKMEELYRQKMAEAGDESIVRKTWVGLYSPRYQVKPVWHINPDFVHLLDLEPKKALEPVPEDFFSATELEGTYQQGHQKILSHIKSYAADHADEIRYGMKHDIGQPTWYISQSGINWLESHNILRRQINKSVSARQGEGSGESEASPASESAGHAGRLTARHLNNKRSGEAPRP